MTKPSKPELLADTARTLFHAHGFAAVTVDKICRAAAVSRPTFYKYYADKNELIRSVFTRQKEQVRQTLQALAESGGTLAAILEGFHDLQRQSLAELYSEAVLRDIPAAVDLELIAFFREMEEEKYRFMRGFFHTLQQRGLIAAQLPAELIELYIREMDALIRHPALAAHYAGQSQQLRRDVLHLVLYGLSQHGAIR